MQFLIGLITGSLLGGIVALILICCVVVGKRGDDVDA